MFKQYKQFLIAVAVALFLLPLASLKAQSVSASLDDPMDSIYPYTLNLTPEKNLRGYFPMSMTSGMPLLMTHCGFNFHQSQSTFGGFGWGVPFPEAAKWAPSGEERLFSMGRAHQALGTQSFPRKVGQYGTFKPALDEDGNPLRRTLKHQIFDPAVKRWLVDYATEHVKTFTSDPELNRRVIFWGLDNEQEGLQDYAPIVHNAFAQWLKQSYAQNGIAGLNEAWQSKYRSIKEAAMAPFPQRKDYRTAPGRYLDWRTFVTQHFVSLEAARAKAMYEADPQHRGVINKSTQQTINMPNTNRARSFDHELFANLVRPYSKGYYAFNAYGNGDRHAFEVNFIFNCIRPEDRSPGYGVVLTETNNHGGPGHQWASTMWRLLANGFKGVQFFCTGWANAKNDYDKFGHIDAITGKPKPKMIYAARWAHAVHRHETFWTTSYPIPDLPKVAMLMPRRDILLSEVSPRNPSHWGYTRDHHWMVYRWLREQGYWVDTLPYSKLTDKYLKAYDALFLIDAEHLTAEECTAVKQYVARGGKLIADARAGYFDEHHRVRQQFTELLGGSIKGYDEKAAPQISHSTQRMKGITRVNFKPRNAKVIARCDDKQPLAYLNRYRKGQALYFNTELGAIEYERPLTPKEAQLLTGPTADTEEYGSFTGEKVMGNWLGIQLANLDIKPGYQALSANKQLPAELRIGMPYTDKDGNIAIVVSNRAGNPQEIIEPMTVRLPLPGGPWKNGLWEPAEDTSIQRIKLTHHKGDLYDLQLPTIQTAGVIWLLKKSDPLLEMIPGTGMTQKGEAHNLHAKAGKGFELTIRVHNPQNTTATAGNIRLLAPANWKVTPSSVKTPKLAPNGIYKVTFNVTPPDVESITPDWLYPLVARWHNGRTDQAVCGFNVTVDIPQQQIPKLLTDNQSYRQGYPYRIKTGATYRYLAPDATKISDSANFNKLTNGFGDKNGKRTTVSGASNYYTYFKSDHAQIVFDLKKPYLLRRIVVSGLWDSKQFRAVLPGSTQLAISRDGKTYTPLPVEWTKTGPLVLEQYSNWLSTRARYVKFDLKLDKDFAGLDEIEIWGLPTK